MPTANIIWDASIKARIRAVKASIAKLDAAVAGFKNPTAMHPLEIAALASLDRDILRTIQNHNERWLSERDAIAETANE